MLFSAKRDIRLTYGQHFLCSGISGIVAKTVVAPLDVVKIRYQVGTPETKFGIINAFRTINKTEGLKAFWKGNFVGCSRIVPYSFIQVLAFQRLRLLLSDDTGRLTSWTALLAGSGAGLFATLVLYPTDVIKTRFILQSNMHDIKYKSLMKSIKTIAVEEGFRGFYKGMFTSIIGAVPYAGAVFLAYETLDTVPNHAPFTFLFSFLSGCGAAALAQTVSFPFDTARKNLQIIPYTGFMYLTYEMAKVYCLNENGYLDKPFQYQHHDHIDQSLEPGELEDFLNELDALEESDAVQIFETSAET